MIIDAGQNLKKNSKKILHDPLFGEPVKKSLLVRHGKRGILKKSKTI